MVQGLRGENFLHLLSTSSEVTVTVSASLEMIAAKAVRGVEEVAFCHDHACCDSCFTSFRLI